MLSRQRTVLVICEIKLALIEAGSPCGKADTFATTGMLGRTMSDFGKGFLHFRWRPGCINDE